MAVDPAYIRNLKALMRGGPSAENFPALENEMYFMSARASIIILGSVVENNLELMLRRQVRPDLNSDDKSILFDYEGPLGTFSAKIVAAYAFGYISKDIRHDFDLIRVLRNEFAHSRTSFGFDTPEIAEVCSHLKTPDTPGSFIPANYLMKVSDAQLAEAIDKKNPKTRFFSACFTVSDRILAVRDRLAENFT